MAILGAKASYHPRWFSRYVPDPDIEGERLDDKLSDHGQHRLTNV
jgi:RND superfamily putative drug exporter